MARRSSRRSSIVEGDWANAKRIADDIHFDDMRDEGRRAFFTDLWLVFRNRALLACDSALLLARVEQAEAKAAINPPSAKGS